MASRPSGYRIQDIYQEQDQMLNGMIGRRFGLEGVTELNHTVMAKMDDKIKSTYKSVEEALTTTTSDKAFIDTVGELVQDPLLTKKQREIIDGYVERINQGVDGKELVRIRKELQKKRSNALTSNGDFADVLKGVVEQVDGLVQRTQKPEVGLMWDAGATWRG